MIGSDGGKPPRRDLGFARQRLRLRAHLGETGAPHLDLGARASESSLQVGRRRQRREQAPCSKTPPQPPRERRSGARSLRRARTGAPRCDWRRARLRHDGRARKQLPAAALANARAAVSASAADRACASASLAAVCLLSTSRRAASSSASMSARRFLPARRRDRAGRRIGRDREPVPAPEIALARHETLTGLELRGQARCILPGNHADLAQAPGQLGRRLDPVGERLDPGRQGRVGGVDRRTCPSHGRGRIDRGFEIVPERGAERGFVALGDRACRSPRATGSWCRGAGAWLRPGFGVEPLGAPLGLGKRAAQDVDRLTRGGVLRLGAQGCGFRFAAAAWRSRQQRREPPGPRVPTPPPRAASTPPIPR